MDLIGIPIRIVVGKKASEGIVEVKRRDSSEIFQTNIDNVIEFIDSTLNLVDSRIKNLESRKYSL